jgi:hypothetical protein
MPHHTRHHRVSGRDIFQYFPTRADFPSIQRRFPIVMLRITQGYDIPSFSHHPYRPHRRLFSRMTAIAAVDTTTTRSLPKSAFGNRITTIQPTALVIVISQQCADSGRLPNSPSRPCKSKPRTRRQFSGQANEGLFRTRAAEPRTKRL